MVKYYIPSTFFFLVVLGFELRASCLQSGHSTVYIPPVYFAVITLEMVSFELFAWVGLEL
jgi:hypothetical protein